MKNLCFLRKLYPLLNKQLASILAMLVQDSQIRSQYSHLVASLWPCLPNREGIVLIIKIANGHLWLLCTVRKPIYAQFFVYLKDHTLYSLDYGEDSQGNEDQKDHFHGLLPIGQICNMLHNNSPKDKLVSEGQPPSKQSSSYNAIRSALLLQYFAKSSQHCK